MFKSFPLSSLLRLKKPVHFESYGGAWHKATNAFVEMYTYLVIISPGFLVLDSEVKLSIRKSAYVNACLFITDNQSY